MRKVLVVLAVLAAFGWAPAAMAAGAEGDAHAASGFRLLDGTGAAWLGGAIGAGLV
ncbi:MAG: hypothetical protein HRF43_02015, partial [Phycisphaerae bacterium]